MAERIEIVITAKDNASHALGSVGSALGGIGTIAGGILAAGVFAKIGQGIASLASNAIQSVGGVQKLEMQLEGLLTQQLMYSETLERNVIPATTSAGESIEELRGRAGALIDQLGGPQQAELFKTFGAGGPHFTPVINELKQVEKQIEKLERQDPEIEVRVRYDQVLSFEEAQKQAAVQSKELLGFVQKLAIVSPFETSQVELITRYSLAAGFGVETTKELSKAFLDLAATQGISSEELAFAFDQFVQLKKIGKLTAVDLRQLRRLGIDVGRVLGVEMGMSVEEFNAQVEQSPELMDKLFESFIKFSGTVSAGAAEKMATTLPGLMSTAHDIIDIGSRNLFRPMVEAVTPAISETLNKLAELATGPQMQAIGGKLAEGLKGGLALLQGDITGLAASLLTLGVPTETVERIVAAFFRLKEIATGIREWLSEGWIRAQPIFADFADRLMPALTDASQKISTAWQENMVPALAALGEALGLSKGDFDEWSVILGVVSEVLGGTITSIGQVADAIAWVITKVSEAIAVFTQLQAIVEAAGGWGAVGAIGQGVLQSGTGAAYGQAWGGYRPPGRQHGGPVVKGRPYMVGESGKELFVPGQSGGILPNNATVTVPVYLDGKMIANVVAPILGRQAGRVQRLGGAAAL